MADSSHIEVAKAYVTIVPSMEGSQKTISQELGVAAGDAAKEVGEKSGKDFGDALAVGLKATAATIAAAVAAVTAAAVATGKAFIDAANDVAEWGNTVDKESQKMNMTAAGYQEWAFILEHAGTSIDGMKTAMKKLTVAAEEGNDAFTALGISQEQLASMTPEETWNATVAALQQVADEGERTALANSLLGKGAVELAPLFNMTAEETAALKNQVYELGGVMSDEAVKAAAEYEDQLQNMQVSLKGLKNNIMSQFLPGMSQVMNGLSMLFSGNGGMEEIKAGLDDITANIAELSPQFIDLAGAIVISLLEAFGPKLPDLLSGFLGFINEAITSLTAMAPSLLPVIASAVGAIMQTVFDCLPLITSSLLSLITNLATWLASGNNIKTFTDSLVKMAGEIVSQIGLILPVLMPAIATIVSELAIAITSPENIQILIDAVLLVCGAVFMAMVNTIPQLITFVQGVILNLGQILGNFFIWAVPLVSQGIAGIVNTVKSWGASIQNYINGLITSVYNGIHNWITNLGNSFINGFNTIQSWVNTIISNIQGFVNNCIATITSLPSAVVSIGENLVKGLWDGISDKVDWVINKIKGMGKKIENAIKEQFGIASPSKVFASIGGFMAEGLGVGFEDEMTDVQKDMTGALDGLTPAMTATIDAYGAPGALAGDNTTYNGGAVTINVYGAEGQDENTLAEVIAEKLEDMTARKGAVYA